MDFKTTALGIELGSTRIKAVLIDENHIPIASGSHEWENQLVDGIWTYSMEAVTAGIQDCYRELKKDVAAMRAIQSKLSVLPGQCGDPVTAKCLTQLAEEIRFSDPVSSEATRETEADLNALTDELQKAVLENDTAAAQNLCKRCQAVLMERNRLCKLEKGSASGGART